MTPTRTSYPEQTCSWLNRKAFAALVPGRHHTEEASTALRGAFIRIVRDGNFTTAVVMSANYDADRIFVGVAKRNPTDPEDSERALRIACTRAYRALARALEAA